MHTSDVHLDDDAIAGLQGQECRQRMILAFARVIDTVLEERASLCLIAGDLFDSSRVGGAAIDFVFSTVESDHLPVILLPGNHDCYDERSVYRKVDFSQAGSHVRVLTAEEGEMLVFPDLHATVWGRAMVDHHPSYRPLEGVPPRFGDYWHLGIAHGLLAGATSEGRSSLITLDEIASSGLDYLALGHGHVFRAVSRGPTTACYSGSPIPLDPSAQNRGSVAVVTLDSAFGVTLFPRSIDLC